MDAQKWNDIPILNKIFPGSACQGTVGVMGCSVHTESVVPSATPQVVIVRNCSLSLPFIIIHPSPAEAASIITSAVQHRSLDGTHDPGDIDRLCGAGALSDLHGLL